MTSLMYSVIKFICLRDQFGDTLNYKDKFVDVVRYLSYICWHMFQIYTISGWSLYAVNFIVILQLYYI